MNDFPNKKRSKFDSYEPEADPAKINTEWEKIKPFLPSDKKRRGFIILWWSLSFFILLLIGTGIWYLTKATSVSQEKVGISEEPNNVKSRSSSIQRSEKENQHPSAPEKVVERDKQPQQNSNTTNVSTPTQHTDKQSTSGTNEHVRDTETRKPVKNALITKNAVSTSGTYNQKTKRPQIPIALYSKDENTAPDKNNVEHGDGVANINRTPVESEPLTKSTGSTDSTSALSLSEEKRIDETIEKNKHVDSLTPLISAKTDTLKQQAVDTLKKSAADTVNKKDSLNNSSKNRWTVQLLFGGNVFQQKNENVATKNSLRKSGSLALYYQLQPRVMLHVTAEMAEGVLSMATSSVDHRVLYRYPTVPTIGPDPTDSALVYVQSKTQVSYLSKSVYAISFGAEFPLLETGRFQVKWGLAAGYHKAKLKSAVTRIDLPVTLTYMKMLGGEDLKNQQQIEATANDQTVRGVSGNLTAAFLYSLNSKTSLVLYPFYRRQLYFKLPLGEQRNTSFNEFWLTFGIRHRF